MTKISALSDIGTSVASNDTFVLVDVSDPTTPNKKIQQQNILAAGGLLPDGSVGTPGLRFLNDTNVGLYRPTTDALAFVTAGENRLHITSAGLVGIGTSSPGAQTDSRITGGGAAPATSGTSQPNAAFRVSGTGTTGVLDIGCNSAAPWIQSTDRTDLSQQYTLLLNPNGGNVGIGTTAVNAPLEVRKNGAGDVLVSRFANHNTNEHYLNIYVNDDSNTIVYDSTGTSGGDHIWKQGGAERVRIDSSGRLLVGTPSARANFYNSTNSAHFQIEGSGSNDNYALSIVSNYAGNTSGAQVILAKSGGSSVGDNTLVSDGNTIGQINFQGADGTEFVEAAKISAEIDGTPGANDMPGRLVFSTTADGASSPTERMRITSTGQVRLTGAGITFNGDTAAANELDDYEEGTFTLTMAGSSTAGTVTYGTRKGEYTKIGNLVTARFYIDWSDFTGTGDMRFGGLPFTASNDQNAGACVTSGVDLPAGTVNLTAFAFNLQSYAIIVASTDNGASANVQCDAQGTFFGCLTYNI
jgi:hypothetical protein